MQRATLLAFLLLGSMGLVLLGGSITGMFAISQSCCFGPTCPADYLCDAAEQASPQGSPAALWTGVALTSIASFYLLLKLHH